jgi:hypothetical protein
VGFRGAGGWRGGQARSPGAESGRARPGPPPGRAGTMSHAPGQDRVDETSTRSRAGPPGVCCDAGGCWGGWDPITAFTATATASWRAGGLGGCWLALAARWEWLSFRDERLAGVPEGRPRSRRLASRGGPSPRGSRKGRAARPARWRNLAAAREAAAVNGLAAVHHAGAVHPRSGGLGLTGLRGLRGRWPAGLLGPRRCVFSGAERPRGVAARHPCRGLRGRVLCLHGRDLLTAGVA